MSETTQGFILGLTAAMVGIILYICVSYSGVFAASGNNSEMSKAEPVGGEIVAQMSDDDLQ